MMYLEDSANGSECQSFRVSLWSLLFEDWGLASAKYLKGSLITLAAVALTPSILTGRGCRLSELSEDIALLILQISEITSFVQTI